MKKLHPDAKIAFFLTYLFALVFILSFPFIFFFIMVITGEMSPTFIFNVYILLFIFLLIFSFIWAHLYYENFRYELQKDKLVIDKGVIWKKNIFIPFNRVQNVDIIRGPVARILGLSNVFVHTAGLNTTMRYAEGTIQGLSVKEAENLKDKIITRVAKEKNQGL